MAAVDSGPGPSPTTESPGSPPVVATSSTVAPGRRRRSTALVVLLLFMPVVVVTLAFFPGHMSVDTLSQIGQARDGNLTNHHAALLTALWSVVWPLGVGPGWILFVQVVVFVVGTYLVLRAAFPPWAAASLSAAIALSPPVFGMLGYVSRDTWFTALFVATFGLVLASVRSTGRRSSVLLAAAVTAAWLALASRQNAIAAVVVVAPALVWCAARGRGPSRGGLRVVLLTASGVVLTLCLFASQVALSELLDVDNSNPEQYVAIYDLAMLSDDLDRNLFPADVMPRRDVQVFAQYFNVDSVNPLLFSPERPVATPLAPGPLRSLRNAWTRNVRDHPVDYAEGRLRLWLRQVALTRKANFIYHPGIDENAHGFHVAFPSLNEAANDYIEAFTADPRTLDGGPLHTVWVYLAAAAGGAVVLLRRRAGPLRRLVGLAGVSAVTHQAGLFFGAMGTQYRFEFPVVVIGVLVSLVAAQWAWSSRRTSTAEAVSEPVPAPPPPSAIPTATNGGSPRTARRTRA